MNRTIPLISLAFLLFSACGPLDDTSGNPLPGEDPPPLIEDPPPLEEVCTSENCAGCCDAQTNKCITTRTNDACGPNGTTCSKCATGMICHPSRQECYTPTILTKVQPLRATLVALDPADESDWDLDGSPPDVVVQLTCPKAQAAVPPTEEVESLTPQWTVGACDALSTDILTMPIQIRVIDVDAFFDDEIANVSYQLTRADLEKGSVEFPIPKAISSIVFQLTTYYGP